MIPLTLVLALSGHALALDTGQRPSTARDPSPNLNQGVAKKIDVPDGPSGLILGAKPLSDLLPSVTASGDAMLLPNRTIGKFQDNKFTLQPDAVQIQGFGTSKRRSVDQLLRKRVLLYQYVEADGLVLQGGVIAAGSTALSVPSATFTAQDVGKVILVKGAGAGGATHQTTIAARNGSTAVTLAVAAPTSVSAAEVTYGTDDTVGVQAALDAAKALGGATVEAPYGTVLMSGTATVDLSRLPATRFIGSITAVNLVGQGSGASKFRWIGTANEPMFRVLGDTTGFAASRQMRWGGYSMSTARPGQGRGHQFSVAADMEFFDTYAMELDQSYELIDVLTTRFFNVSMNYGRRGLWAYRKTFSAPNAISFFGGEIDHMNEWGAVIEEGSDVNFFGTNFQANGFAGAAPERGGIRIVNPGQEGGVAININGGYNEVQGGQGLLWVTTAEGRPVTVNVLGLSSNQGNVDVTKESVNSIRVDAAATGPVLLNLTGSSWRSFGGYSPSAARPRIATTGPVRLIGEAHFQNALEAPFMGGSGAVAASGAGVSLPFGVTVQKVSTGTYRIVHNAGSTAIYAATAAVNDGSANFVSNTAKAANATDIRIVTPSFAPVDAGFDFILRRN